MLDSMNNRINSEERVNSNTNDNGNGNGNNGKARHSELNITNIRRVNQINNFNNLAMSTTQSNGGTKRSNN